MTTSSLLTANANAIAALAANDVAFKEFGYATGAPVGGSEAGQEAFVTDTFAAWSTFTAAASARIFAA